MSKEILILGVILFSLIILVMGYQHFEDDWKTKGFPLKQNTTDWADWQSKLPPSTDISNLYVSPEIPDDLRPGILLRYAENNNNVLLLKHTIGEGIYSFDVNLYQINKSTQSAWDKATGDITVCQNQRGTRADIFKMDAQDYKFITWGENPVIYPTYGKYAIDAIISPSKTKAAILSAYGPKRPFFRFGLIFGGEDIKIYGQKYFQIMDLATKKYDDKPVKLHSHEDLPCFSACWSPDEKILIAYECDYSNFQIVEPFK